MPGERGGATMLPSPPTSRSSSFVELRVTTKKPLSTWRKYELAAALEKASQDVPLRTKVGDSVISKVVCLARWKKKAKSQASARPFKMSAQSQHLQRLRHVTLRNTAHMGSALEHDGLATHVRLMMQVWWLGPGMMQVICNLKHSAYCKHADTDRCGL